MPSGCVCRLGIWSRDETHSDPTPAERCAAQGAPRGAGVKRCRKCHADKGLDDFSPRPMSRDGRRAMCKECMRPHYKAANAKHGAVNSKKWRTSHVEQRREAAKKRRHAKVEQFRAEYRRQYAANAAKRAAAAQARRDRDRDGYNEQVRLRRAADPTLHRSANANRRAIIFADGGKVTSQDIKHQLAFQHEECFYCSVTLDESYEVDHFVALINGGAHSPDNIVVACRNCNRKKNRANGLDFILRRVA